MKKYKLIVYKEQFGWENYSDDIYLSGEHDNANDTEIIKETNSFPALMRMWHHYFNQYCGYTYCVKEDDNFLVGGV